MNRIFLFLVLVSPLLAACVHTKPYSPANSYERKEYPKAAIDVYPDTVRANSDHYTNVLVAWVGVIRSTEAEQLQDSEMMRAVTTLDHRYYDWEETHEKKQKTYLISPRGEGAFRVEWMVRRKVDTATTADAETFAAPGKLAIVYGVPEKVDENGVVVLKYHYLRVLDPEDVSTDTFDYGRIGEPYRLLKK